MKGINRKEDHKDFWVYVFLENVVVNGINKVKGNSDWDYGKEIKVEGYFHCQKVFHYKNKRRNRENVWLSVTIKEKVFLKKRRVANTFH